MKRIAIIGAGISGLSAAKKLCDKSDVSLFEKSRGVGGRMATRRLDTHAFDHGAQYFTIKSDVFRRFLDPYLTAGVVVPWAANIVTLKADGSSEPHETGNDIYVAAPGMNALGKALVPDLKIHFSTQITHIFSNDQTWMLEDQEGTRHGPFDWVISSAPAPQTEMLMPAEFHLHTALSNVVMHGCFTVMIGLDDRPEIDWDAAFVENSPIGWIALNSSKPDRMVGSAFIIQSTNEWAEKWLEKDKDEVTAELLQEAEKRTNLVFDNPVSVNVHRWRYANVVRGVGEAFLLNKNSRLAACGDWCLKGRVEAAFESGHKLATRLLLEL